MMGKKLGLGWSRALPVIRQKEDLVTITKNNLNTLPVLLLDPLPASRPLG